MNFHTWNFSKQSSRKSLWASCCVLRIILFISLIHRGCIKHTNTTNVCEQTDEREKITAQWCEWRELGKEENFAESSRHSKLSLRRNKILIEINSQKSFSFFSLWSFNEEEEEYKYLILVDITMSTRLRAYEVLLLVSWIFCVF